MSTSKHQNRSYNISNRTRKFAAGKASLALALAAAAALGLSSLPSGAAHGADVTATWQDAANGAWDNGNNWNTAPNYPMNGNPSGDVYNVVIPLVTAGTSVDLNGLTSPAAIGSLSLASGMTITNSNSSSQTLIIDPSTAKKGAEQVKRTRCNKGSALVGVGTGQVHNTKAGSGCILNGEAADTSHRAGERVYISIRIDDIGIDGVGTAGKYHRHS